MRGQSQQASCGQTAAANALRALGKEVSEDAVARRVKLAAKDGDPATVAGTTEAQLLRVFRAFRVPVTQVQSKLPSLALTSLRGFLLSGRPVCLAVHNDEHWVAVIGLMGSGFIVADGADDEIVRYYSEGDLANIWAASGDAELRFYGLAAGKGVK